MNNLPTIAKSKIFQTIFILLLVVSLTNIGFGQTTDNAEKQANANATFNEAFGLFNQGTAESYKAALAKFQEASRLYTEIDDKSENAGLSLLGSGLISDNLGDKSNALIFYEKALTFFKANEYKKWEATTLSNIGLVYDDLGEKQKALDYYNQALPLIKEVGDKSGEAITLNNIMYVWESQKNLSLAVFYGKQSVNVFQELRANIKGLDKAIQQTYLKSIEHTYRGLSDIMIGDGRLLEAQAVLDLLKEEEFEGILRRSGNAEDSVPYSQAEKETLAVIERLATLGREKSELDEKLAQGSLTDAEKQKFRTIAKNIEIAEAEFNKFIAALSDKKNKGKNYDVVVADAQAFMTTLAELGKGTVALYTVIVNESRPLTAVGKPTNEKTDIKTGWVILVTPQFRKAYPIDVKNLEKEVFTFRTALSSPVYDPAPLAQTIYTKMFRQKGKDGKTLEADLQEYLKDKPEKTLMWSLDGVLRYIPIAALHDGSDYLVKKYRNTVFNTASKGRLKDASPDKLTVLGLGVSEARTESGKSFQQIEGAKRELETIVLEKDKEKDEGILLGTIILNKQLTAEAMQDAITFDKNPVVHIASHFSYNPADFDQSFLLLGQGKITVKDLTAKSSLLKNVDLMILSACDTAVGGNNGKDVEGFAYVAQSLGAKTVIATLWQVDDIGTQVLMPEFYHLRKKGIGKGEAIRQSQISLLEGKIKDYSANLKRSELINLKGNTNLQKYKTNDNAPFAHPYYWSPFVLIGNWR